MSVEAHLFTRLSTFAGLAALVTNADGTFGIYDGTAPEKAELPFVVLQEISYVPVSAMGNDTGLAHSRFQVDAYADTEVGARAVATQVRLALQRYRGTVAGNTIQDIFAVNRLSAFEEAVRLHRFTQDFMVHHVE